MFLSTGDKSTLSSYKNLCELLFGKESKSVKFIEQKIKESLNGGEEQVLADESQMMCIFLNLEELLNKPNLTCRLS
jgi:hypothetical protein